MKDDLSQNIWKYDVFCIFCKDGISFSDKYEITPLSKKQMIFFRQINLKVALPESLKKI